MKSLDKKLKVITAGKYKPTDFILADAKDPADGLVVLGTTGFTTAVIHQLEAAGAVGAADALTSA